MKIGMWVCIGIMAVMMVAMFVKILILQNAAREIALAFADRLSTDTNTLIDISTGDKYMRSLAKQINAGLRTLRAKRHRYLQGDMELKNAITNISHDLRTPLTAICGYLDLLEQEDKSENVTRYLEVIRNRTEMLRQLTDELFRYSIILDTEQKEHAGSVVINQVLEESIAAFYAVLHERGISPQITMPEVKVTRALDPSNLARVFSNLLNNAVKYSDGDLDITLSEKGEIVFENTAAELNEVQVGKLFDRFYTVEAARQSTGLGLSIAKKLVQQMNGTITAEYGNGRLRIVVWFPEV